MMWVRPVRELGIFSSFAYSPLQQTSDNTENMKDIERRVQSLSGVLASPVTEDDYGEKRRRVELKRFAPVRISINLLIYISGSSRRLW
jgi:hypothetical protein